MALARMTAMGRPAETPLQPTHLSPYFIRPAAVSARVMTAPTSMLRFFDRRGGATGRFNVASGRSTVAISAVRAGVPEAPGMGPAASF
jgi:hypothetical protein